jgi:hypothetical protein
MYLFVVSNLLPICCLHILCIYQLYLSHKICFFTRYLLENKLSQTPHVRRKLKEELGKIELLQENIIVPYETLQNTSLCLESTNITESLQYRERGLLHISDATYDFFLSLEQARVEKINLEKLRSYQTDMMDTAMKEAWEDEVLQDKFVELFNTAGNSVSERDEG